MYWNGLISGTELLTKMLLKCKLNKCQGILLTEINISKGGVGERQ